MAAPWGPNPITPKSSTGIADVNAKDDYTPLMWAIVGGHTEIVIILIQAGADMNVTNKDDKTALDMAREDGHDSIVQLLLQAGAVE